MNKNKGEIPAGQKEILLDVGLIKAGKLGREERESQRSCFICNL